MIVKMMTMTPDVISENINPNIIMALTNKNLKVGQNLN